jgi:hypothetical protein
MPERSGIPWMVILDSAGKPLITSDGPRGNIGYPFEPHEIEHFIVMLQQTAQRLTADQIAQVEAMLQEAAKARRASNTATQPAGISLAAQQTDSQQGSVGGKPPER